MSGYDRDIQTKKSFGAVYTPEPIVDLMLEQSPEMAGLSICDPACGDGQFLVRIADTIAGKIAAGERKAPLMKTLRNLTGYDIDRHALKTCASRLNRVMRRHQLKPLAWQLKHIDALDRAGWQAQAETFDLVIGNPPYIRIQHLEEERRRRIRAGNWSFMSGSCDLFILFYEMGLRLLKKGGHLVYITSNSWLKSKAGEPLRAHLRGNHAIRFACDFGAHQVFAGATTYTAIFAIEKQGVPRAVVPVKKCLAIRPQQRPELKNGYEINLRDNRWAFLSKKERRFLSGGRAGKFVLSDIADIHVGIQTLADNVFIRPKNTVDWEPAITRRILKASIMKNGADKIERVILYPYRNGRLLPEQELAADYPRAYAWLVAHQARLRARDKGRTNPDKWYGYGREVSILSGFGKKILTAGMNSRPDFQQCDDRDALFYSGYCVKPKTGVNFANLLNQLNSDRMDEFIRLTARPYQNGWFSYAKSFISDYPISEGVFDERNKRQISCHAQKILFTVP